MKLVAEKRDAVLCPRFGHRVLMDMCGGCNSLNFKEYHGNKAFVSCSFTLSDEEVEQAELSPRRESVVKEQAWMLEE